MGQQKHILTELYRSVSQVRYRQWKYALSCAQWSFTPQKKDRSTNLIGQQVHLQFLQPGITCEKKVFEVHKRQSHTGRWANAVGHDPCNPCGVSLWKYGMVRLDWKEGVASCRALSWSPLLTKQPQGFQVQDRGSSSSRQRLTNCLTTSALGQRLGSWQE